MSAAGQAHREPGWPSPAETPDEADELAAQGRHLALSIAAEGVAMATGAPLSDGNVRVVMHVRGLLGHQTKEGRFVRCDHLAPPTSNPAFWLPSIPTGLVCRLCLPAVPVPANCDGCAIPAPLALRRWTLTIDQISVVAYFCAGCRDSLPAAWRGR